jgi:DNA-binding CsgD family transcriptional regulator
MMETKELTDRQKKMILLTASDKNYLEIADELCISESTLEKCMRQLAHQLSCPNTKMAIVITALKNELISLADIKIDWIGNK